MDPLPNSYKKRPFEDRKREADEVLRKYPDRIPMIVEAAPECKLTMPKKKFLVPGHSTVGEFVYFIRKHMKLQKETALFIFCNNVIPTTSSILSVLYAGQKDTDGFLYITYSTENTFGACL